MYAGKSASDLRVNDTGLRFRIHRHQPRHEGERLAGQAVGTLDRRLVAVAQTHAREHRLDDESS